MATICPVFIWLALNVGFLFRSELWMPEFLEPKECVKVQEKPLWHKGFRFWGCDSKKGYCLTLMLTTMWPWSLTKKWQSHGYGLVIKTTSWHCFSSGSTKDQWVQWNLVIQSCWWFVNIVVKDRVSHWANQLAHTQTVKTFLPTNNVLCWADGVEMWKQPARMIILTLRKMLEDTKLDNTKSKVWFLSCNPPLMNGDNTQNNWTQTSPVDFKESDFLVVCFNNVAVKPSHNRLEKKNKTVNIFHHNIQHNQSWLVSKEVNNTWLLHTELMIQIHALCAKFVWPVWF